MELLDSVNSSMQQLESSPGPLAIRPPSELPIQAQPQQANQQVPAGVGQASVSLLNTQQNPQIMTQQEINNQRIRQLRLKIRRAEDKKVENDREAIGANADMR